MHVFEIYFIKMMLNNFAIQYLREVKFANVVRSEFAELADKRDFGDAPACSATFYD